MIEAIVPLIIAFAATLVGIVGNTWDKRKKGCEAEVGVRHDY